MKKGGEQNPLILNLLEANQIQELIRMMFNRKTSEDYLQKYGARLESGLKKQNQGLIEGYVERFQIKDVREVAYRSSISKDRKKEMLSITAILLFLSTLAESLKKDIR